MTFPLASVDKVMEAYGKLRSANHIALALERNRQRITMEYAIR
jgi:hypothetical protein